MRHNSQRDRCDCNDCDDAEYVRGHIRGSTLAHVCTHTYTQTHSPVPYYPGSGLFHYGKSRLHFFTSPNDRGVQSGESRGRRAI